MAVCAPRLAAGSQTCLLIRSIGLGIQISGFGHFQDEEGVACLSAVFSDF